MAFGMSGTWICLSSCNNIKNEVHQKNFKTEMKNQLDRIENNVISNFSSTYHDVPPFMLRVESSEEFITRWARILSIISEI